MKKIITTIVLGLTLCLSAVAEGPKYHLATSPSSGFMESRQTARAGCTPATAIRSYKPGSTGSGLKFGPAKSLSDVVSTDPSIRTSRTVVKHKVEIKQRFSSGSVYAHRPTSSSIVTSSATSNSSSATQYGSSQSALGLKSSASTNSSGTSGAGGGSSSGGGTLSSGVTYGRTSSTSTSYVGWYVAGSGSGGSSSFDASTRDSGEGGEDSEGENQDGFGQSPKFGSSSEKDPPVGDAILPLLLLLSIVTVYKWKFKK